MQKTTLLDFNRNTRTIIVIDKWKIKKLLHYTLLQYYWVFLLFISFRKKKEEDRKNAPYIDFKSELKILVNRISFERNELYLNEKYYNANRITDYTDVYCNKATV